LPIERILGFVEISVPGFIIGKVNCRGVFPHTPCPKFLRW